MTPPTPTNSVVVVVKVPTANTAVLFDGAPTKQTGTTRVFETPDLKPGKTYAYRVEAHWKEGAEMMKQTRKIHMRVGQRILVDFTVPLSERLPPPTAEK
jgi:uncharacterized protein (TIGR03000 family)